MSQFLQKIKNLFISEEKKFTTLLLNTLELENSINIRKIISDLSLEKRYVCLSKLLSSKRIKGVFLPEKSFFFAIPDDQLSDIRNKLKQQGVLEISSLKELWSVDDKTLTPLLYHLERGLIGGNKFYTINYLQKSIISNLSTTDEYALDEFTKKTNVETELLLPLVNELIEEKQINGVIKNDTTYLSFETFERVVSDFIESKLDEDILELSFEEISLELEISTKDIERFMVNYVEKNLGNLVVYPLEKKIMFKE